MSYRDRSQKQITLPSGATITIWRLSAYDSTAASVRGPASETDAEKGVRWARYALLNCCGPLSFEGELLKIVDRQRTSKAVEGEITIEELDQEDAHAIIHELSIFSKLTKEAAAEAKSFREPEQENNGHSSHPRDAIRDVAVENPEAQR